jgi:hypothetical protein
MRFRPHYSSTSLRGNAAAAGLARKLSVRHEDAEGHDAVEYIAQANILISAVLIVVKIRQRNADGGYMVGVNKRGGGHTSAESSNEDDGLTPGKPQTVSGKRRFRIIRVGPPGTTLAVRRYSRDHLGDFGMRQ